MIAALTILSTAEPARAQSVLCSVSAIITGLNSTACGAQALINGNYGVVSGFASSITGNTSAAYGAYSLAGGDNAVAIGAYAQAANAFPYNGIANATAIGAHSTAGVGATANGAYATATGLNASAFGSGASATAGNSVALGNGSVANVAGTVSIGSIGAERKLVNLAAGTLSANSTDAVNGGQLFAVSNAVASNTQDILANTSAIALVNGRFALASQQVANGLGGGSTVSASGYVTAPNYSVLGGTYNNVGGALAALSARVNTNSVAITAIGSGGGNNGLIVQDPVTQQISVASTSGGTVVDFSGTGGSRRLTGIASGSVASGSTDAVTGAQLYSTNVALADYAARSANTASGVASVLGGGAQINPDGTITAPSYTVLGHNYTSVATAILAMDAALANTNSAVTQNTTAITQNTSAITALTSNNANYNTRLRYASINGTGQDSSATGANAVAFGSGASSSGNNAVAVGFNTVASRDNAVAVGNAAQATGVNAIAIGTGAVATGSVALGVGAQASNGGAALGDYAVATGVSSAGLGPKSRATGANAVAIGAGSVATEDNIVSVGAPGSERRITNVAAGISPTDAVNVGQLNDTSSRLVSEIARLDGQMDKVRGGVAMAMAMGGGALPNDARFGVAVNVGTYGGQTALGVSHYIRLSNAVVVSGSIGLQSNQVGGRAGIMAAW